MASFRISQNTRPSVLDDQSRHDLVVNELITLTALSPSGSNITYEWEIVDSVGPAVTLSASTGPVVTITAPATRPFSILVEMRAKSGSTVVGTVRRIASATAPSSGLRIPLMHETASAFSTRGSPDVTGSTDNATYANLAGGGVQAQNHRGWAEFLYRLVMAVEAGAGGSVARLVAATPVARSTSGTVSAGEYAMYDISGGDVTVTIEDDGSGVNWISDEYVVSVALNTEFHLYVEPPPGGTLNGGVSAITLTEGGSSLRIRKVGPMAWVSQYSIREPIAVPPPP